jgi:capsular exopolysaccharide synthesis family protein
LSEIAIRLPYNYGPSEVRNKIRAESRTNVISITAKDVNPVVAADVANTTAETLINVVHDRTESELLAQRQAAIDLGLPTDEIDAALSRNLGLFNILEGAFPSSSPSNDSGLRNIVIAAMLGFILAGIGALSIEYFDQRIKSEKDMEALTGFPVLGSVPRHKFPKESEGFRLEGDRGRTPITESYRLIQANLDFGFAQKSQIGSILVTSSTAKEGKTSVAVNLAYSMVGQGRSAILVNLDLGDSHFDEVFDLRESKGVVDLLRDNTALDETLVPGPVTGLNILPLGSVDHNVIKEINPSRLKPLIEELKRRADLVIVDGPPLLAVTDAMILASLVEGVILVVDASHTPRNAVSNAVERLNNINPPLTFVGSVLNKTKGKRIPHYGNYFRNGNI